jgi:hypothetical protein
MWICVTICRGANRRKAVKVAKRDAKKSEKKNARLSLDAVTNADPEYNKDDKAPSKAKKKDKKKAKKDPKKSKNPKRKSDAGSDPKKPPATVGSQATDRGSKCCHCGEVLSISTEGYRCKYGHILTAYPLRIRHLNSTIQTSTA